MTVKSLDEYVTQTCERNRRILALLKRVQWEGGDDGGDCPDCGRSCVRDKGDGYRRYPESEHDPSCELAALIRELEGESGAELANAMVRAQIEKMRAKGMIDE